MELWLAYQVDPEGLSLEQFLDRHADYRDLLEPMALEEDDGSSSTAPPTGHPAVAPGATIGGFRLLHEIGRGGMGVVWAAQQPGTDRTVALKLLRRGPLLDPRRLARFRREAATAGQLEHPHLVRVLAADATDEIAWIAMEHIDGAPLHRWAERETSRGTRASDPFRRQIAHLLAGVAEGLAHAHERGVVHRDVKPSNILVRGDQAFLTDFGIARRLQDPSLTRTGEFAGTPDYVSPEQARGDLDIDGRSDVFSLGATFYELLTGRRPFADTNTQKVLERVQRASPPHPRTYGIGADAAAVLERALAKDRRDRYQDAALLAADLRALAEERAVVARPLSPWIRIRRLVAAHPIAATALTAGIAMAVAILLLSIHAGTTRDAVAQGSASIRQRSVDQILLDAAMAPYCAPPRDSGALIQRALSMAPDDPTLIGIIALARTRAGGSASRGHDLLAERLELVRSHDGLQRLYHHLCGETGVPPDTSVPEPSAEPGSSFDHYVLGELTLRRWHFDPSQMERARELLMRSITLSERPRAEYFMALRSAAQGCDDLPSVLAAVDGLIEHWPDAAASWGQRASAYAVQSPDAGPELEQRRWDIARRSAERSLALEPDNCIGLSVLQSVARRDGDMAGADRLMAKLTELHEPQLRWMVPATGPDVHADPEREDR